ncbi:MAG TPA: D-alanyl-D-alanine carboxypeptidase family protein [Chloroflexia bacterium]|nr:D-alanyl-D-alanine carboxypeptidase family protein [Chloroflexia bacterium]
MSRPQALPRPIILVPALAAVVLALLLWTLVPVRAAAQDPPTIAAKAAIVVEYPSGRVLYTKNEHKRLAMASTTKIMTALLALQRVALTDVVTATAGDLVGESTMGLVEGEQQTVSALLYGLMLPSGNDAAMVLARHVGSGLKEPAEQRPWSRFITLMNRQAQQMGLMDTHFTNPHGFDDPDHYSSAYDLASMTWYDLHYPVFNEIISEVFHNVPGHHLVNTNEMLTRYAGADGAKTGMTDEAGNCLVTTATRDGRRLIAVVLGEVYGHTYPDSAAILDYGFANPGDETADAITVARRAQLLTFLSAGLPTPLPTPRPTAVPTSPPVVGLNLGGFLAPAPAPQPAAAPAGGGTPAALPATDSPPTWIWSLLAVPAGALLVFGYLQLRPRRQAAVAVAASAATPVAAPMTANGKAAKGKKAPPAPGPRRVTLLGGEDLSARAERAVALAYHGQEGASLAEFLLIVKKNPDFEFGTTPGFYDMPAAGYLALARAYAEQDRTRYATALLKLGHDTYPADKAITRMLAELEPVPAADPA